MNKSKPQPFPESFLKAVPLLNEESICIQMLTEFFELAEKHRAWPDIIATVNLAAISITTQTVHDLTDDQRERLNFLLLKSTQETINNYLKTIKR